MLNSKRFIAFVISVVLFTAMVFLTKYPPMECAGAISIIAGIYLGVETYRSSNSSDLNPKT